MPAASGRCWSSKKSAASSKVRSATPCITCRGTNGRKSAARPILAVPHYVVLVALTVASVVTIGFGFFAYLQAVTIAPVECFAVMNYTSHWWRSIYDSNTGNVTGIGFVLTIVLMAIFVAVNFLAMRLFARVNWASPPPD